MLGLINFKRTVILLLLGTPFIYGGLVLFAKFPSSYTWSELVINYQGGFVRRGLLGEISYQLNGLIQARYFLCVVSVVMYLLILAFFVYSKKISYNRLLFLFSPAVTLFPIYDIDAFARKDVYIIAAFVFCLYISERGTSKSIALLLAMAVYGVTGLVVETAWFYLPMAAAVIILNRNEWSAEQQTKAWSASFFFLVGCFVFISLANSSKVSKVAIVDSWRLLYPSTQWGWNGAGAVNLLGLHLNDGLLITFYSLCFRTTLEGYFYSFLLASIPTLYLLRTSKFNEICKNSKLGIVWALVVMSCSFAFAADWGRCIYLFTIHTFLFLTIITTPPERADAGAPAVVKSFVKPCYRYAAKSLFIVVYATSWQVQHWVVGGQSALRPGLLFVAVQKIAAIGFAMGSAGGRHALLQ